MPQALTPFFDANVVFSEAHSEGLPLQDASVLAAAVHAGADLLVTGDARDFGRFYDRTLRGVQVITPARALDIVLKHAGV